MKEQNQSVHDEFAGLDGFLGGYEATEDYSASYSGKSNAGSFDTSILSDDNQGRQNQGYVSVKEQYDHVSDGGSGFKSGKKMGHTSSAGKYVSVVLRCVISLLPIVYVLSFFAKSVFDHRWQYSTVDVLAIVQETDSDKELLSADELLGEKRTSASAVVVYEYGGSSYRGMVYGHYALNDQVPIKIFANSPDVIAEDDFVPPDDTVAIITIYVMSGFCILVVVISAVKIYRIYKFSHSEQQS